MSRKKPTVVEVIEHARRAIDALTRTAAGSSAAEVLEHLRRVVDALARALPGLSAQVDRETGVGLQNYYRALGAFLVEANADLTQMINLLRADSAAPFELPDVLKVVHHSMERQADGWQRLAAADRELIKSTMQSHLQYKQRRNRRPSEVTVERDAEIARLRDHEHWLWKQIEIHFGLSQRSVLRAYQRHHRR
jgi:hypothetical protein